MTDLLDVSVDSIRADLIGRERATIPTIDTLENTGLWINAFKNSNWIRASIFLCHGFDTPLSMVDSVKTPAEPALGDILDTPLRHHQQSPPLEDVQYFLEL